MAKRKRKRIKEKARKGDTIYSQPEVILQFKKKLPLAVNVIVNVFNIQFIWCNAILDKMHKIFVRPKKNAHSPSKQNKTLQKNIYKYIVFHFHFQFELI